MGNPVFHFKHFSVCHHKSAMKVGTDGVLLGSWAPADDAMAILDVGTGTGLIALMLAQRQPKAAITAIDIDAVACKEAAANFDASPWSQRLLAVHTSLQDFSIASGQKYDLLVSNPPYFNRSLQAPSKRRSTARHDETLSITDLVRCSSRLLNDRGVLALIHPVKQYEKFCLAVAEHGLVEHRLVEQKRVYVYPKPDNPAIRIMSLWGFIPPEHILEEHLLIEDGVRHQYSDAYRKLTRDFYLLF